MYGIEAIFPIECEIPYLKLLVELLRNTSAEEECLLYLMQLDETHNDASLVIETKKKTCQKSIQKTCQTMCFFLG
jgi:hypothetical protein